MSRVPSLPAPAALAARLAVGGLLVVAGALKAAAPAEEFAVVIDFYQIVGPGAALPLAALLPWLELLAGFALVLGVLGRWAALGSAGLYGAFCLALASVKARGIQLPSCGCFGGGFHPSTTATLSLDLVLLALAVLLYKAGPGAWSLDNWSDRGYTGRR